MRKKYFYEFSGRIYVKADNQAEAEKLLTGIQLEDFLLDENLYEVDEDYIALDQKKRQEQMGTHFHPLDNSKQYEAFKMRECRYNPIFNDFLNGRFGMNELMKRIAEADENEIDDSAIVYQVQMVDLESKEGKTARLVSVN